MLSEFLDTFFQYTGSFLVMGIIIGSGFVMGMWTERLRHFTKDIQKMTEDVERVNKNFKE